jgi:Carboxypeptidase regulatory-like domain/TonB-dependent Receptor Plug Domain
MLTSRFESDVVPPWSELRILALKAKERNPMTRVLALIGLCLALAMPAGAQVQSGTIAGVVADEQGAALPGAVLTLTSVDRTATFTTESDGRFRFLNLPPGTYSLTIELQGFSKLVRDGLVVSVGTNVDLPITLKVATVAETVTVTGETPTIDTKATGTSTNFTQAELDNIPTSRDPWALLRTVPGVVVDRVNIAGNETGQQSNFQSKATRPQDAVWTMDGVVVTDMAAIGSSPTYFNYDNFEEVRVSTAGQDLKQPTGGVGLNLVIKRGTNQFRGNARGYFTHDSLEGSNVPDELKSAGVTPETADHNRQISDYTLDAGGPIVRERAWFYGSWANQDIRLVRRSGNLIDRTVLKTFDAKGNWQMTSKDMFSVLWFLGAKEKYGRSPGITGINDAETATWNQGGAYIPDRPRGLLKFEDNHTFNSSLFVTGKYAYYNTGFGLVPKGGLDMNGSQSQVLGRSFGSYQQSLNLRPQHTVDVDANYFKAAIGAEHELKFGGGFRRVDSTIGTIWPGDMVYGFEDSPTNRYVRIYREALGTDRIEYLHFYGGDTISKGRLTIDAGVRYDRQWGRSLPSQTRGNPSFPNIMPGVVFDGYDAPFTWNDFSPRAGLTFALDDARKTLLRATFSRAAGQLEATIVGYSNLSGNAGYIEYPWVDSNGDHLAQPGEVQIDRPFISFGNGFDPSNPSSVQSVDIVDPKLRAPHTTSVVVGIDRELVPNLAASVNYSYTRTTDVNGNFTFNYTPWIGVTAADYRNGPRLTGTLPDGIPYDVQTHIANESVIEANGFGTMLTNHPGYYSYYNGVEFALTKRLSNRWMARVGASWNSARECYDVAADELGNPTPVDTATLAHCGPFTVRSGGSGSGDIFIHANWQVNANALYVLPHGINVAANLFARQGYPYPVYRTVSLGYEGSRRVLLSPKLDTIRLDDLWDLDLRGSKTLNFGTRSIELIADLFNVFNANTELVRNRNAGSTVFQSLTQNLSPRILRFGVRVAF